MKGKKTEPKLVEELKALSAVTGNISEASRLTGLPVTTGHDVVRTLDDFEEYREDKQRQYIEIAWSNILKMQTILDDKLRALDFQQAKRIKFRELTGCIKDLNQTIINVLEAIEKSKVIDGSQAINIIPNQEQIDAGVLAELRERKHLWEQARRIIADSDSHNSERDGII